MVLTATGHDPESGLREAPLFFLGKALPDGKAPPDAVAIRGENVDGTLWAAMLSVPKDQRDPLPVNVIFTNNVGLTKTATLTLPVIDPLPPPPPPRPRKKKIPSIAGTVVEGELPQVGLTVELFSVPRRRLVDTTKTTEGGKYVFKDLEPGAYRVVARKSASRTSGQKVVEVKDEEQKEGIDIKLYR